MKNSVILTLYYFQIFILKTVDCNNFVETHFMCVLLRSVSKRSGPNKSYKYGIHTLQVEVASLPIPIPIFTPWNLKFYFNRFLLKPLAFPPKFSFQINFYNDKFLFHSKAYLLLLPGVSKFCIYYKTLQTIL